jgi:hypothetical protein
MRLSRAAAAAVLLVLPAVAATAPRASAATVPLLSGAYVYSSNTFCQLDVTVKYASAKAIPNTPFVAEILTTGKSNTVGLAAGTLTFTQTAGAAGAGKVVLSGRDVDGSSVLLTSTGAGTSGTDGAAMESQADSGSATFQQTAATFKLTEGSTVDTYHIYYGKVTGGIAQFATLVGTDSKGCAERYTLTHS